MIVLLILIVLYFNLVIYLHQRDLTNVYTIKDYFKYNDRVNLVMNLTVALMIIAFYIIYYTF